MAEQQDSAVVLMSIKPRWAEAIMDGRKRVEFRRARFSRNVSHVIVYSTSPVQKVVGFFEVAGITEADPRELWDQHWEAGGIDETVFRCYYEGTTRGVAIHVGRVTPLDTPIALREIIPGAVAPQSYMYAGQGAAAAIGCLG